MIALMVASAWRQLARDRAAQVLIFVVPVVFFSVLTVVFGDRAAAGLPVGGMASFQAAATGVMFLMFTMSGAGGALLEETESGTLERVLTTGLGMGRLLLAKWAFLTLLGVLQVCVMFGWGALVFRVPLLQHAAGFAVMAVMTAAACAGFGLVLATLARSRAQLQGLANLVVLPLSALGGSMFPRFLLPEWLQQASLVGFNAWALEGWLDVFWRGRPLSALAPEVAALAGFTAAFLALARLLARRWEVN